MIKGYCAHLTKSEKQYRAGLKSDNIIYRGCVLRNTDTIAGLVIYAGLKTKSMLSNSAPQHKVSLLEQLMNRDIILFAGLLVLMCCSTSAASVIYQEQNTAWYFPSQSNQNGQLFIHGFFVFLTMVILLQILIPISLYVSIELVKLVHWSSLASASILFAKAVSPISSNTIDQASQRLPTQTLCATNSDKMETQTLAAILMKTELFS